MKRRRKATGETTTPEPVAGGGLLHRRSLLTGSAAFGRCCRDRRGWAAIGQQQPRWRSRPWMQTPGAPFQSYGMPCRPRGQRTARRAAALWRSGTRCRRLDDASAPVERHDHAERPPLRAPSQRGAGHRSSAAQTIAPWSRRAEPGLRRRRPAALPHDQPHLLHRMLRQQLLQCLCRTAADALRHDPWPGVLQRMDRDQPGRAARRGRRRSERHLALGRGG